jgi:TetR/AcrR family transcriptional regulator, transcriptional repressor for nem operon
MEKADYLYEIKRESRIREEQCDRINLAKLLNAMPEIFLARLLTDRYLMGYSNFRRAKGLKSMARLREFDTDEVLESVIQAFWERGYEATSMADLMAATGLQKGSLYKAFGDKRSLFLKALQTYLDRIFSFTRQALGQPKPANAIAAWIQLLSDTASAPEVNHGCFAVNSLIELAPHDPDVAKKLEHQFSRVGDLLESVIAQGQQEGVFRKDLSAEQLRFMLLTIAQGALASGRAAFLKSNLSNLTDSVLAVLKP